MSKEKEEIRPLTPPEPESEDSGDAAEEQQDIQQQIIETGAVTPTKGKYVIHCLTIVGQIEGHYILPPQNKTTKYEHVIPQLVAIQENPEIQGLIIILNTVGGDVEAGLAIAELVSGMKKPTVSLVLGGGHSIGVPLAVSARKSFIVPSATMTIHPVRMNGVVLGVPQTLSYFDKMQERIVRFVEDNSNIDGEKFRELMMNTGELVMDVGTVLDGEHAVEVGLIDRLGGLSDAINCLYELIEAELPAKEDGEQKERGAEEDDGDICDFSPALASPRAAAQLMRNGRTRSAHEQKPPETTGRKPAKKVRPRACRKPLYTPRPERVRGAASSCRSAVAPRIPGLRTRQRSKTGINRHTPGAFDHKINGSGGGICDVNPFGHSSPYAD